MISQETKTCQNCRQNFVIEPEDFNFYEKIKVPPPTWCPECRMVRRMMWRNERTLYWRKCNLCNKNIVSIYNPASPFIIYCFDCFYSDSWDCLTSGREFDFKKSFFQQFWELELRAPKLALQKTKDVINSEWANHIGSDKNCYLIFAALNDEDCAYCAHVSYSKNVLDGLRVFKSEYCYECVDCRNCHSLKFSQQCQDCFDGWFLYDCRGCSNCFLCSNLIKKSYCVKNTQYSKEEYKKIIERMDFFSRKNIGRFLKEFNQLKRFSLHRSVRGINHQNSTGDQLSNVRNCRKCFDLSEADNCAYVVYGDKVKDTMDAYAAYPTTELCYETVGSGNPTYKSKFSYLPWQASDIVYSINTFPGCRSCFGCNQILSKQHCILNRQYTKEEYEELVPKIIKHMNDMPYVDKKGRVYKYGEFFPPELSPFCYNETIAQEYFPLTKEQAIEQGYQWKDPEPRNYQIDIKTEELPDNIKDVKDEIIGKVIECSHKGSCTEQCTEAFKIIPDELTFYRRMNLPLPRLCPNCRHYQRLKQRNPLKLWHRQCMCEKNNHHNHKGKCEVEFKTSYAPDRPEIVYCEECYKREVY